MNRDVRIDEFEKELWHRFTDEEIGSIYRRHHELTKLGKQVKCYLSDIFMIMRDRLSLNIELTMIPGNTVTASIDPLPCPGGDTWSSYKGFRWNYDADNCRYSFIHEQTGNTHITISNDDEERKDFFKQFKGFTVQSDRSSIFVILTDLMDKIESDRKVLKKLMDDLGETRQIECHCYYYLSARKKEVIRMDTGEIIETKQMTDDECQGELFS